MKTREAIIKIIACYSIAIACIVIAVSTLFMYDYHVLRQSGICSQHLEELESKLARKALTTSTRAPEYYPFHRYKSDDELEQDKKDVQKAKEDCTKIDYYMVGACCGVGAGIIGLIGGLILTLLKQWKIWSILHGFLVFLSAMIAFALPIHAEAGNCCGNVYPFSMMLLQPHPLVMYVCCPPAYQLRAHFHLGFTFVYMLFLPFASFAVFWISRKAT